jgi:hypothetical protein
MLQIPGAQPLVGPIVTGLLLRGLTENQILKIAEVYLSLLNITYSAQDLTKGMIKTIYTMMTTTTTGHHIKTTSNDKLTEILNKVRPDLSQLDYTN